MGLTELKYIGLLTLLNHSPVFRLSSLWTDLFLPVFQLTLCRNSVFVTSTLETIKFLLSCPRADLLIELLYQTLHLTLALQLLVLLVYIEPSAPKRSSLAYLKALADFLYVIRLNQITLPNIFSIKFRAKLSSGCLSMELC